MRNKTDNITIVDTHGHVFQVGTQGVLVVTEDEIPLLDINEVSDETIVNVFFEMTEPRTFVRTPDSEESGILPQEFEMLIAR